MSYFERNLRLIETLKKIHVLLTTCLLSLIGDFLIGNGVGYLFIKFFVLFCFWDTVHLSLCWEFQSDYLGKATAAARSARYWMGMGTGM